MMTGLECGHKFCTHCWGEYLTTKIMEEGLGQSISCAAHGCDIIVDDVTVMKLVNDSRVRLKYQHLITNSFVEVSRIIPTIESIKFAMYLEKQFIHFLCAYYAFTVQSFVALVSISRLFVCCESGLCGISTGCLQMWPHILLWVWRKLAWSRFMQIPQKMDQKMWRRFGNIELDCGQYKRMPEM